MHFKCGMMNDLLSKYLKNEQPVVLHIIWDSNECCDFTTN